MKIEVKLATSNTVVGIEGDKLTWEFEPGWIDIYADERKVATYRLDQVLWVRVL